MVTGMTTEFDSLQFKSAATRLSGKPLVFTLETIQWPDDEEAIARSLAEGAEVGQPITVTFMVNPKVDVVTLGVAFGAVLDSVRLLGAEGLEQSERLAVIERELPRVRDGIRRVLTPPSRIKWDEYGEEFDAQQLSSLVQRLVRGLSGMDPTQQASSTDGSPPTGPTSTDGVPATV